MTEVYSSCGVYATHLATGKIFPLDGQHKAEWDTVLCLGNFDGVHRGHSKLISLAVNEAKEISRLHPGTVSGAWFFSRSTREYKDGLPCLEITPLEEKLDILRSLGIEYAFVADFDSIRDMPAKKFIDFMLTDVCRCRSAVCGYNFRFGKSGMGDAELLCRYFGGRTHVVDCVCDGGVPISSSLIRECIERGDMETAKRLMGRPFALISPVVSGKRLGRTIGFPTANQLFPTGKILPRHGVYATAVTIEGIDKKFVGVSNVGSNPTVNNGGNVTCETFITDFDGDIYGRKVKTEFYRLLREEKKFDGLEELRAAIAKNANEAREYFAALGAF